MNGRAQREAAERQAIEQQLAGLTFPAGGRPLKPCGTLTAYRRHLRAHEVPCQPCCDANAAASRAYRPGPTKRRPIDTRCGTDGGYQKHVRRREVPCQPCKDAHAKVLREYRARKREEAESCHAS